MQLRYYSPANLKLPRSRQFFGALAKFRQQGGSVLDYWNTYVQPI